MASESEPQREAVMTTDAALMADYDEVWQSVGVLDPGRLFLAVHIRRRLVLLRKAYARMRQHPGDPSFDDWLARRIDALKDYESTFDLIPEGWGSRFRWLGGVLTTGVAGGLQLLGIPVAAGGTTAIVVALVNSCFCKVFDVTMVGLIASIYVGVIAGFGQARGRLLKGADRSAPRAPSASVYQREHTLFGLIDAREPTRVQWDVVGQFGVAAVFLAGYFIIPWAEHQGYAYWPWWTRDIWMSFAVFSALLGLLAVRESRKRPWGWGTDP